MSLKKKVGSAAALVLVLGSAEALLRHEYYRLAIVTDPVLEEPVNAAGTIRWRREGNGTSHWTDHGVRRIRPPNATEPRILVLGDSFTEALQVDDGETFADVVEADVRAHGGRAQLVNAGFSSRSAADHIALAPSFISLFAPVWTVVELQDSDLTEDAWASTKTHFSTTPEGGIAVVRVSPPGRGRLSSVFWGLRQRSSLVGYTFVRFGELREVALKEPPLFRAADAVEHSASATPPTHADVPVEKELDLLASAYEGKLTILYLSAFDPSSPTVPTPVEARVAAWAAEKGMSFTATRERFDALGTDAPFGFANTPFNEGHMNVHGHRVAGDVLAHELERRNVDGVR